MSNQHLKDDRREIEEPTTPDELFTNLIQDLVLDNDPNILASDFIDEFVLRNRPETPQILAMLEMPTPNLIEMLKYFFEQGYQAQIQAIDERGLKFLESLKIAVKTQMTELAQ